MHQFWEGQRQRQTTIAMKNGCRLVSNEKDLNKDDNGDDDDDEDENDDDNKGDIDDDEGDDDAKRGSARRRIKQHEGSWCYHKRPSHEYRTQTPG